jgi:hypothetical protein
MRNNLEETMVTEARETLNLIGSDKVEGTAVYGPDGTKIDDYYPLPWQSLKYDTNLGGYVTGITEAQLKNAPRYSNDNAWNWGDPAQARSLNDYYGIAM